MIDGGCLITHTVHQLKASAQVGQDEGVVVIVSRGVSEAEAAPTIMWYIAKKRLVINVTESIFV